MDEFYSKELEKIQEEPYSSSIHLPLARIKRIMKSEEDVGFVSSNVPILLSKAIEIFVRDITHRAWQHTSENRRNTVQKQDIQHAVVNCDVFDFLIDIIPRESSGSNNRDEPRIPHLPPENIQYFVQLLEMQNQQPASLEQQQQPVVVGGGLSDEHVLAESSEIDLQAQMQMRYLNELTQQVGHTVAPDALSSVPPDPTLNTRPG